MLAPPRRAWLAAMISAALMTGAGTRSIVSGARSPPPQLARTAPYLSGAQREDAEGLRRERAAVHQLPEQYEECLRDLVTKAIKWWVNEGRSQFPLEEAALIRRAAALAEREQRAARGEEEDPAETGRWAHPIFRPGWYMRPLYYKFDFDTCLFAQPLRAHPLDATLAGGGAARARCWAGQEAVTLADLTKKLFKCAYKGQAKRARACVRAGANINAIDFDHPERLTPFLWAACGGSPRTVEALAQLGAGKKQCRHWSQS